MNNWKETTLGGLLEKRGYIRGPFGSALRRGEMKANGIPVYEQQNAIYNHREFRYFINEQKYKELSRFTVRPGDLIISCSGTLGKVSLIEKNHPVGIISQALLILRSDAEKILPRYLFYFLNSPLGFHSLVSRSTGSVQINLAKREIIEKIPFRLPPVVEQEKIVRILSGLDDKIELLRKENETLEKIAQTVFKEWFVNFNLPAEVLTKVGVDGEKLKLENGIPEGWRVGKLGEAIELFDSKRVPLASDVRVKRKGKYPYYGATSIMDHIDNYLFDGTYLLLAEDGSVMDEKGRPVLQYVWGQFWVSNHAHVLQGKNGFSTEILYVLLKKANVAGIVNGAVQLKINQQNLINYEILIPPKDVLEKFDFVLQPIFKKSKNIQQQIQTLSRLRDTLLPKLMSGEISY